MQFDLSNRNLAQKISILVLGITLFVSLAIGGVGEMVLQSVGAHQAKHASSVASLDRLIGQGGAMLSPVRAADGRIVGMLVMQQDAGAAVIPAAFDGQGLVVKAAETVVAPDADYAMGAAHVMLLLAGIAVFAVVALVGTRISRGLLAPLGELEKDIDRLAQGDTSVRIHDTNRTDEIGRIARSIAKIQESLVELARLKTQKVVTGGTNLINNLKELWGDLKGAVRNAREMIASDSQTIGQNLTQSWRNWLHTGLGIPSRA